MPSQRSTSDIIIKERGTPMKMKKIIPIMGIFFLISLFAAAVVQAETQWAPKAGNEHNMVAYGKVFIDSVDFRAGGYVLYSFGPGGDQDCRSKSVIAPDGNYYATIGGDIIGERIHFKVLAGDGTIFNLRDSFTFEPDVTKGKFDIR